MGASARFAVPRRVGAHWNDVPNNGVWGIPLAEPDVAVLDVRLSDGSGVEVCREIRSRHPEIKCVMFSAFDDEVTIVESILAGASGFVLKQIKGGDIVNAVRMVASGESLFEPTLRGRVLDNGPGDEHCA